MNSYDHWKTTNPDDEEREHDWPDCPDDYQKLREERYEREREEQLDAEFK